MKNKINILIWTFILTIIVFTLSINLQKRLVEHEPKIECLVLIEDILENERVSEEKFKLSKVPVSLIASVAVISNFSEIEGMYAKSFISKGQIAFKRLFDTQENLLIFEAEKGTEKISVKIENPENGVSYAIKKNSLVNLYATIRNNYAQEFLIENERLSIGDEYEGYTVIKILDEAKVLGTFNIDGIEITNAQDGIIDSIMLSVTPDIAKQINLIRDIATFNITGITKIEDTSINSELQSGEAFEVSGDLISG
ncbi:MAG: SAF domain-containing protein [Clostridia bacterium]|nr:SAF domain-containing protein [Clostridia bacterium]